VTTNAFSVSMSSNKV